MALDHCVEYVLNADTEEEQHHEERSQVVSFETIARDEQGHINMSKLTLEQKKVWNAYVGTCTLAHLNTTKRHRLSVSIFT